MASNRAAIEALLSRYDAVLREAFLGAIDDIRNGVTLRVVVERLERGDVNGAIDAMGLDPVAFERLERAIEEAYNAGGTAEVDNLPRLRDPEGGRVLFRFGTRNTPAERELREHSSTLVTRIIDDQRVAIRTALSEGLSKGKNPRSTALDVIGRVNRASNRREGGVVGLTSAQERYVANAREQLASSNPDQLRGFLSRERRDKRFDRTILKAIREGKPLSAETQRRIAGRYADSLLQLRGEMIARTETLGVLARGRDDAIRQQIAEGKIEARDVTKTWRSAGDSRVRDTHAILNGQSAEFDQPFISSSGASLRFPHDPEAPPSETVLCRCFLAYKTDYVSAGIRRRAKK